MKKLAVLLAGLTLSAMALAGPIKGTIAFVGTFQDNVDTTTGNGTLDFSNVIQWSVARTDDFQDLTGDFFNVAFGPISVTGNAIDLPVNPMWNLNDGFGVLTSFVLDTIDLYTNNANGVEVQGSGVLSLTGYDDTRGVFSLDTANNELTFDADATAIPVPSTMALIGIGLIGLMAHRKMS